MEWMLLPYRRYFDFAGRSRRKEYWMFALFQVLVSILIGVFLGRTTTSGYGGYLGFSTSFAGPGAVVQNLFALASFIPNLAVSVRRLHDQDRSGWLLLLILIPIVGWFALFVFMCLEGTQGRNRFGDDPKNPQDLDTFS